MKKSSPGRLGYNPAWEMWIRSGQSEEMEATGSPMKQLSRDVGTKPTVTSRDNRDLGLRLEYKFSFVAGWF